jgi:hypothetical protein
VPKVTGWGTWGFVEAIATLLERALTEHDFDYFQLLSPTCLPLRPIDEFEDFVSADAAEVHADLIDLGSDPDALMHYAYRTYVPQGTLRFRLLRRLRALYFGPDAQFEQTRSLSMLRPPAGRGAEHPPGRGLALAMTRAAAAGAFGGVPFGDDFRATIGSTWFGARRHVCEYLLARVRAHEIVDYFQHVALVDESVFANLIANSGFRVGRSNHVVSPFDALGHPHWITDSELDRMFATGRFFGRKFPEQTHSPVRLRALARLRGRSAGRLKRHARLGLQDHRNAPLHRRARQPQRRRVRRLIPFEIRRVYYLYDIPAGQVRAAPGIAASSS